MLILWARPLENEVPEHLSNSKKFWHTSLLATLYAYISESLLDSKIELLKNVG